MSGIPIQSCDDPRLFPYRIVSDPDLARERGWFVAEGREVVRRLLETRPADVESVLATPPAHEALAELLAARAPSAPVFVAPPGVMVRVTGFNFHRGCLALARRRPQPQWRDIAVGPERRDLVVAESLSNPDNVGALFRNARALGAAAVLLSPGCTDPYYRKAIRTSMGASLSVPWTWAVPWPGMLRDLRDHGVDVVALTPRADAAPIDEVVSALGARVAWLVGNEASGLSDAACIHASRLARIPQVPGADSLNVATAAAIALYLASKRGSGS